MDDIKILLYIALGAIFFISRLMKNRKKQQQKEPSEVPEKELSFEDLIKQFTEEKQETKPISADEKPAVEYKEPAVEYEEPAVEYEEPAVEYEEPAAIAQTVSASQEATSVYERSIDEADKVDEKEHVNHFKQFGVFEKEEENTFLAELGVGLQEKEELKKAIIYKEIFDRRYF